VVGRSPARTARQVPVVVDADLRIDDPWGRTTAITVHDGRGTIVVPGGALRYSSLRALPRDRARWSAWMRHVLAASGLAIEVTCKGRTIATISVASNGNWLARLLRLGPMDIRLRGVLAALLLPAPATGRG
jgi:hypothetical protein